MNLWDCPVITLGENGKAIERNCIIEATDGCWHINVTDKAEFGTINTGAGMFPSRWLRATTQCSEKGRWLKVNSCMTEKVMQLSSSTLWSYFGIYTTESHIELDVSFAHLPSYLPCDPAPVQCASTLSVRPINNSTTVLALLHPDIHQMIERALKLNPISAVVLEGSSFWVSIDGMSSIPLIIDHCPVERFVDTQSCEICILPVTSIAKLPPLRAQSGTGTSEEIKNCMVKLAQQDGVHIFGLSGPIRISKAIVQDACAAIGISTLPFPIEDPTKIVSLPFHVIWVLTLNRTSRHAYSLLRKVSLYESKSPCAVMVLYDGVFDDSFMKVITRTWKVPIEDLACAVDADGTVCFDTVMANSALSLSNIESISPAAAMKKVRKQMSCSESSRIPQVLWENVAGLDFAKKTLIETFQTCLFENHRIPSQLGRRCGILFFGPPGTGKTLLAKAVATEFNLSFLSIKGPELLDVYVGESEAHIRDVFARAKACRPCVLFFDELDSIAVARGKDGDAGGITDRLVSQLVTEIDALTWDENGSGVFLIGATNRPDLLDPSLLRPGRFDKRLYLGIPQTSMEQAAILRASSTSYLLGVDVDFDALAKTLPKTLSPADLASICHTSMKVALGKVVKRARETKSSLLADQTVSVGFDDLIEAAILVRPSISATQLDSIYKGAQLGASEVIN
ncbi:hypothetical protein PSACC_01986 [Paramicrosporidium saccamoebae]|uniref:Peroxisomal ATPase PEX6 n=1 Tax=Paramicrosporidium saccamoebae TaxID=1246581 RepID=A0A2H9TKA9_9FUNG|nr:hypothetical protein PSACC_01986 [Paramicrosporidium saccamoebae]